jgi:hypothetical protein
MNPQTNDEVTAVVAAAHADRLVAEVVRCLAAVDLFDAEGALPFAAVGERTASQREARA